MVLETLILGVGLVLVSDEPATGAMCLLEDFCQLEAPIPLAETEAPQVQPCEAPAASVDEQPTWSRLGGDEDAGDHREHRQRLERPPRAYPSFTWL